MITKYFKVAGFVFGISVPEEDLTGMTNLKPFECRGGEDGLIFHLGVDKGLEGFPAKLIYRTDDGPGFPEIALFESEGGWIVRVKPLPNLPEASVMWMKQDFSEVRLQFLDEREKSFALNNALMLIFAFSTARRGALEMHSSVVMNAGKGYMFLGKSGTGKSTHSRLWMKHIPGTELLNDDNPILRLMPDGTVRVFGSPWSGKTPCYKAKDVPAGAVVSLKQAPFNRIERLSLIQAYATLMSSSSAFRPFKDLADGWHGTIEGIVEKIPCYQLECLPDREAAELCHSTVNG
ncbi:MAG: hypothetical protein IKN93_02325 [Bacteroidales bacterium]|nr:hypothetical protein [Bacteroidales bacterium]